MGQTDQAAIAAAIHTTIVAKQLDKIHRQPSYSDYKKLRHQIAEMTALIMLSKWGGNHSHLALVPTDTDYQTTTGKNMRLSQRKRTDVVSS